jgi:glutathione synthase/RimK-type ligase-like ATP-grasp enzyme
MILLNIVNEGVMWRIFEKEELKKVYKCDKVINIKPFEDEKINNILLKDVNVVIFRLNTEETTKGELDWSIKISNKFKNIPIINNPNTWKYCHCKIDAFKKWKQHNIPIIDNFDFLDKNDFYDKLKNSKLTLPIIIKVNNLCGGNGSFLIKNKAELDIKLTKLINFVNNNKNEFSKMLCVKFIESRTFSKKYFVSYRIIATPDDVIGGYVRISKNWLVQWSTSKFTKDIENEFLVEQKRCEKIMRENKQLICKAVKTIGMDGVGLDLLIDSNKNNLYFLEAQIGFSTGYPKPPWKPPYYRPNDPNMVKFLYNNREKFSKIIPLYYNGFLDKKSCFNKMYSSIRKRKKKKILYCDIDSTINNHWVRIKKWALPSYPGDRIHLNAFSREEVMKDDLLPGAKEAIEKFIEKGWEINFLTARSYKDAYNITKDWLNLKKIPYNTINCVNYSKDKPEFLKEREVDLFIDDLSGGQEFSDSYKNIYYDTIEKLKEYNIPFIRFKGDWDEIKI